MEARQSIPGGLRQGALRPARAIRNHAILSCRLTFPCVSDTFGLVAGHLHLANLIPARFKNPLRASPCPDCCGHRSGDCRPQKYRNHHCPRTESAGTLRRGACDLWETGANPRDTVPDTRGHRGSDVIDCRKVLCEAGFMGLRFGNRMLTATF